MNGEVSVEKGLSFKMIWQEFTVKGHIGMDLTDVNQELGFIDELFWFNEAHKHLKVIKHPRMEVSLTDETTSGFSPQALNLKFLYWGETPLDFMSEMGSFFERLELQMIQFSTKTYHMSNPQQQEEIVGCFQEFLTQLLSEDEGDSPSRYPLSSGDFKTKFVRYFDFFNTFQFKVDYFSPQQSTDFGEEYVKLTEPVTNSTHSFYRSHGVTYFEGAYPWSNAYPISNNHFDTARGDMVKKYLEAIKKLEGVQSWETLLPESIFKDSSLS